MTTSDNLEDKFKKLEGGDVDAELAQLKRGMLSGSSATSKPSSSLPEGRPIRYCSHYNLSSGKLDGSPYLKWSPCLAWPRLHSAFCCCSCKECAWRFYLCHPLICDQGCNRLGARGAQTEVLVTCEGRWLTVDRVAGVASMQ